MIANTGAYVCRVMICDTINALVLWLNVSIYCYGNPKNIINSFTFSLYSKLNKCHINS